MRRCIRPADLLGPEGAPPLIRLCFRPAGSRGNRQAAEGLP